MVLDPFTALGLAGNIGIYASDENAVLEVIARNVTTLSDAVAVEQAHSEPLRSLATETKRVATELLAALERLKVQGPKSRWKSLKVALKKVWGRKEIDSLEQTLLKLQAQVTAHVQHLMGSKVSEISVAVASLTQTNNSLSLDMKKLVAMEQTMKDVLEATKATQPIHRDRQRPDNNMQALSRALSSLGVQGQTIANEQCLLTSLHFPMIQARHENVEESHANTFEWIFSETIPENSNPIRFVEWLEQGTGIFWIHGKPGCGKSTLMKFLCNHGRTRKHLSIWGESHSKAVATSCGTMETGRTPNSEDEDAKKRLRYEAKLIESHHRQRGGGADGAGEGGEAAKLVTAKHFFWNSGSKLQKSQEGLLRSLVFEILHQCPELVAHVLGKRSEYRGRASGLREPALFVAADAEPWPFEELLLTLQDIISVRVSATFCLFIDGLDEYEEENRRSYRDLVDTLYRIAQSPNPKVCASSRPLTVFLDAFKNTSAYSLKLEDLTRGDIRRFVSDKFEAHDQYQQLKAHDAGYETLVEEVATRAQGVFLWVYLVVNDLLEGLTYNDSVHVMRERLDQFPEDLEDFFQHMIDSIPPIYRRLASRTFFITMEAPKPLLLTLHAFLNHIETEPDFFLDKIQRVRDAELLHMHDRMRRQLEGRTKGLLEVVLVPGIEEAYLKYRVDFLHRTVRDFLKSSSKAQSFMQNDETDASKIWVLLSRGALSVIRHSPLRPDPRAWGRTHFANMYIPWLEGLVHVFVYFSDRALQDAGNTQAMTALFKAAESTERNIPQAWRLLRLLEFDYLVCLFGGLRLLRTMDPRWLTVDPNLGLLQESLSHYCGAPENQVGIVTYLLKHGIDPNEAWLGSSSFDEYMRNIYHRKPKGEERRLASLIIAALVSHGADPASLRPVNTQRGRRIDFHECIREIFPPELASKILEGVPDLRPGQNGSSTSPPVATAVSPPVATAVSRRAKAWSRLRGVLTRRKG